MKSPLVSMLSKELWLVPENRATVKLEATGKLALAVTLVAIRFEV